MANITILEALNRSLTATKKYIDDNKANINHGNHVPSVGTADNATYLRNDNTWHTITPSDINAAPINHGQHVTYSDTEPLAPADTASAGTIDSAARADHVHPAQVNITGNAETATKLQNPINITLGKSVKEFDGSTGLRWDTIEMGAIPLAGTGYAITGDLLFKAANATSFIGIGGQMGGNDYWRIVGGGNGHNQGYVEIAAGDDGTEPIYVRQRSGGSSLPNIAREATLLDAEGNTSFPGKITVGIDPTENMDVATKQYVDNAVANGGITSSGSAADYGPYSIQYNSVNNRLEFIYTPTN